MTTQDGASLAKHGISEVRIRRALLAARRLTDAVEASALDLPDSCAESVTLSGEAAEQIVMLRADADAALYDAEIALGILVPGQRLAAAGFAQWPPPGIPIDAARRLVKLEMDSDLIERVMVANKRRDAEPGAEPSFACANDNLIQCLNALAAKRIAELAALEAGR